MQGSVFTAFSDMVIDKLGMESWDAILKGVNPKSGGIYTSGAQYDDAELVAMVQALSEMTQIPVPELVRQFGHYLFTILYHNSPADVSQVTNLREFLLMIDGVIHKEVKRLYPSAYLPRFSYDELNDGSLVIFYDSKRKLCHLSIGLIEGAAEHFGESIVTEHPRCMLVGHAHCEIVVKFVGV